MTSLQPSRRLQTDRRVRDLRGPRNRVDPRKPYALLSEQEPDATGIIRNVSTIFLTNRECPWKCVMCDLWKNTITESVPAGAIPMQIDEALRQLPPAQVIKLYNSGSFFDRHAIPEQDYSAIASRVKAFDRVIVECHPLLVGPACLSFRQQLSGQLEIAVGLETANAGVLAQLNKGMTLDDFLAAADFLQKHHIALRVFLLVNPPFIARQEAEESVRRSIDIAFDSGASVVSLIPTRGGNGAMEALSRSGEFEPPTLQDLERATDYGLSLHRGRIFADVWDLEKFSNCAVCFPARMNRLTLLNRAQSAQPPIRCEHCENRK